jgi:serine/threonine protein kinase
MLKGVKYCHENGVLHLDIKPANFMINIVDKRIVVKLIDFGNADRTGALIAPSFINSLSYRPPDRLINQLNIDWNGKADLFVEATELDDCWALGCTLVELFRRDVDKKAGPCYQIDVSKLGSRQAALEQLKLLIAEGVFNAENKYSDDPSCEMYRQIPDVCAHYGIKEDILHPTKARVDRFKIPKDVVEVVEGLLLVNHQFPSVKVPLRMSAADALNELQELRMCRLIPVSVDLN